MTDLQESDGGGLCCGECCGDDACKGCCGRVARALREYDRYVEGQGAQDHCEWARTLLDAAGRPDG